MSNIETAKEFKAEVIKALNEAQIEQSFTRLYELNDDDTICSICAEGVILTDVLGYKHARIIINPDSKAERSRLIRTGEAKYPEIFRVQPDSSYSEVQKVSNYLFPLAFNLLPEDIKNKIKTADILSGVETFELSEYDIQELNDDYELSFKEIARCIDSAWTEQQMERWGFLSLGWRVE